MGTEHDMETVCFDVCSQQVCEGKLSEAEVFGLFASQVRRGRVCKFKTKNGLKNRATQGNWDNLHFTHK